MIPFPVTLFIQIYYYWFTLITRLIITCILQNAQRFLLTYCIRTPWCRDLLEKLIGLQLVKKFPAFHGTRRFITALTSVRHQSLSWASPIQSIYPHPTSWRSILILSTYPRLGLPSGLLPSGFPSKNLYTPFSSPIRATCPAHLILLDFITRTILGEQSQRFLAILICSLQAFPLGTQNEENYLYHWDSTHFAICKIHTILNLLITYKHGCYWQTCKTSTI